MNRRPARLLLRAFGLAGAALAVVAGARGLVLLATPAPGSAAWDARTLAGLRHLSSGLEDHADAMQRLFPEGRLFTVALTGLAWAEVGERDAGVRPEALRSARRALALAEGAASRETFGPAGGLPLGMFHEAWTARLRLGVVQLAGRAATAEERDRARASCRRLDRALSGEALFVESYPGAAWPADNVVGAAALRQCGDVFDPAFARAAEAWLARAREREDPATGLLPHAAWAPDARGSSSALMIPLVAEIDPAYARRLYARFAEAFETRLGGALPAIREYPHGTDGPGDVDSGPLVGGASAPGSVVGIAAATVVGDRGAAQALRASTEALGAPVAWRGRRWYGLGQLPVGDAFLAWASARRVDERAPPARAFGGWRLRWALASAGLLLVGGIGLGWAPRRSRRARRSPR